MLMTGTLKVVLQMTMCLSNFKVPARLYLLSSRSVWIRKP